MYNGYNISCSGSIIFISVMKKKIYFIQLIIIKIFIMGIILVALAQLFSFHGFFSLSINSMVIK